MEYGSYIYQVKIPKIRIVAHTRSYSFLWWSWNTIIYLPQIFLQTYYSYREPERGDYQGINITYPKSLTTENGAFIHTHAAYSGIADDDYFSPADLDEYINYLVTPIGTVRKYTPFDGKDIIIFYGAPYDFDHPARAYS